MQADQHTPRVPRAHQSSPAYLRTQPLVDTSHTFTSPKTLRVIELLAAGRSRNEAAKEVGLAKSNVRVIELRARRRGLLAGIETRVEPTSPEAKPMPEASPVPEGAAGPRRRTAIEIWRERTTSWTPLPTTPRGRGRPALYRHPMPPGPRARLAARIEEELRANPKRTNKRIAAAAGASPDTVWNLRRKLNIPANKPGFGSVRRGPRDPVRLAAIRWSREQGCSLAEIADEMGISKQRVSQLLKRAA